MLYASGQRVGIVDASLPMLTDLQRWAFHHKPKDRFANEFTRAFARG